MKKSRKSGHAGCGTVECAGGCGYMTYGKLGQPVYCMDCGKKKGPDKPSLR